ncbi:alanine racemase [Aurantiacibacter gilvus]|uniref:alanine racemase n=1 Tax=Aurantiacibacter gilvus TaxID=3139141 RepID=A0ABU9IDK6_9SPHN
MTLPEPPPASLRLGIDKAALADNWRALGRLSGAAEAGAAVKADGYGLGVDHVLPALLEAGARQFFVAHWSEVVDLLKHVPGKQVSVLHGIRNADEAAYAKATGTVPVINSLAQAHRWNEAGGGTCHLMIDSGINRLGIAPDEAGDPAIQALRVDTLMSHLASADEDSPLNERQLATFRDVVPWVQARQLSLANSAGIALGADYHFDLTRPGLSLYGGVPRPELAEAIRPVVTVEAAVLQVRNLQPGDVVGYNAVWRAQKPTRAATISLGYADGILRCWAQGGALQHGGDQLPIIGRVSMDMVVVDCGENDLKEGDFCNFPYGLPQAAELSGLSQYELLTLLGKRFLRQS